MISALNSILFVAFFWKYLFLKETKKSSHMGLNQDYSGASSVHMQNDQEIGLRGHASRKYHAESPKHLLCAAWFHPA
jgi:hypothetical protein